MEKLERDVNIIKTFNIGLASSAFLLFITGIFTLYSATHTPELSNLYKSQLLWFVIGLSIGVPLLFINFQIIEKFVYPIYAISIITLILVLFIGDTGGGAQRWLKLGFIRFQPSEFSKIALALALAKYFTYEKKGSPYNLRRLILPMFFVLPPFGLVLLQPDLGTAGILFLIFASVVFFLKVHWKSLVIVGIALLICLPIGYKFVLHDYQRERIKTFLDPGRDAQGSGYNSLQCKIAVGSGKFWGKGFLKGTQSQLNFIPEHHTDFIFSVLAEEFGFLGGVIILTFFGLYFFFSLRTVARAREKFEMLSAIGLTSIVFWHAIINISMVIGIVPIVGVGLPFFSYGGSSLIMFTITTCLLLNIGRKRFIF